MTKDETLTYVIKWLEANGHSKADRIAHNGDMDKCYACGVIDRCIAALKTEEVNAVSAAGVRDKPGLCLNPTAVAPDCLLGSDRADAAKTQQSQPETATPLCPRCGFVKCEYRLLNVMRCNVYKPA